MITGVSSNASAYQYQPQSTAKLTDEKKAALQDILSKYDSEKMTADSTKTMMEEIRKAGYTASDGSKDVIEEAGFSLPKPPQGENGGMPPPPPPDGQGPQGAGGSMPDYMQSFFTKQQSGSVTQSDIESLVQSLQADGTYKTGMFVDQKS